MGESLTPETIVKYASAYAEYCDRGHIVIGRDGRITGRNVLDIVVSTLCQMGSNVTDLGICPTPTVALAVEKLNAAGGVVITASHNPAKYNGFKIKGDFGGPAFPETIEKVEKITEIMKFGVMTTPAFVVDGTVKSAGRVLSADDIKKFLA